MSDLVGVVLRSIEYGSMYALAALGIILVYRTSYATNFAQATIGMFSTYTVAKLIHDRGMGLVPALLVGIITAVIIGVLIDVLIMRRASSANPIGKQIITLGISSILLGLAPMIFGVYNLNMPRFIPQGSMTILGASISYNALFNIFLAAAIMLGLFAIIQKTKLGLAIRTTASNEKVARMMGVPSKNITMLSWAVAGVLSLMSGVMTAPYSSVSLVFMNDIQITAFLATVLGGFNTFYGAVIASYLISIALNLYQVYMPLGTVWGKPVIYALLLLVMYFKPYGLFGKKRVKKV
ncbi:branched-chain amino acid ABC transporter permease [Fundicoccus culcitae]|uniref:Branched-chain amino acid ABC transporter permease n=1 Tax=Fundicoccus culcitae TaxID=2969821 RepID=A0ABY5P8B3_9LACT|nr:branched-chain amino acid ABC transporter permease [Fundicoccus culcitae]UUX34982.1 branched-chain amino acid ABC transporter permease [Fundicoccus culcitae]